MTRRLLLLINSLEGGGAEKVMVSLADHLAQRGDDWELCLATLDDYPDAYQLSHRVERVRLDCRQSLRRSVSGVRRLIADRRPDVVLSFLTRANCAALLARRQADFRCVVSERVHTTSHLGSGLRAGVMRSVVRRLYPRADGVIAVSRGVAADLSGRYRVPAGRIATIHNPVFTAALRQLGQEAPQIALPADYFVAVGRLVPNKGGETLLRAFAAHANRDRALVLLGEGPERARLETLAAELGIADRLHMPGFVGNPQAVVARATAYVSASRSEGFPNALVEAMALGRAVISTDCASGPSEILAGTPRGAVQEMQVAHSGILVPVDDAPQLTRGMDLMDDAAFRQDCAARALDRVGAYAPETIFRQYESVLTAGHRAAAPSAAAPRVCGSSQAVAPRQR
ncbi:glycosyltransferase [Salipiger mucosus]|uniref:Glycosyl transferase, group 1 n=1 Tax=Salipiger mucosus DSM 16094 TaxID=1123237 RepID=S9SFB1_9RHOB|nr:glycosyltransferase [Salipiger mucosus]EPX84969.1 glycosyl transferase, group 1 [Salipiger mucosus DSM 16094]